MTEKYDNADLIDYAIIKSRQVVRSVLESERFTLMETCDDEIIIQHDLKHILGRTLKSQP